MADYTILCYPQMGGLIAFMLFLFTVFFFFSLYAFNKESNQLSTPKWFPAPLHSIHSVSVRPSVRPLQHVCVCVHQLEHHEEVTSHVPVTFICNRWNQLYIFLLEKWKQITGLLHGKGEIVYERVGELYITITLPFMGFFEVVSIESELLLID